jgi:NitT/TauT family transport system permease protein
VRTRRTITSVVLLLVSWELVGRYVLTNQLFFAPPSAVVAAAFRLWGTGELQKDILVSFTELLAGMLLAIVLGVIIGVVQGVSVRVRDYTEIYITILFATPLVAIAPLLILWMGIGMASKIMVVLLTAIFPIIINTAAGIRATDVVLIEVARSFCATPFQVITKVLLPSSLPFMLAGIRLAAGRGIVGVVVGELFGSQAGLGNLIQTAGQTFDVPALFVGVFTLAAAGVALTALARFAEQRALRWRRSLLED